MKNIIEELVDLLKKDERFVSQDGVLLKNQTQELARKNDPKLIKLLLSDKAIKQHFFFEVEKTLIFDKEKFIRFISNKQFLPDSYTAFKNKIGLITGDEYVSENKEVVLVWPYKDCVLEGGMTKEDQKRDEVFYNETLAPDDINRLLDAKVFTNFKRIDKKGEHRLDGFKRDEKGTIKDNLIIKGNNLLALASLKKEFAGKVKLIYIDPPYYFKDTKTDDTFSYNSNFKLSTWLTFMKNRLDIARDLLRDDGVIFIQIKDDGMAHLKLLMDDIFIKNGGGFVNNIVVKMSEATGVKMSHSKTRFPNIKEYILFYKKSSNFKGFYKIDKYENKEWDKENNIFLEAFEFSDRQKLLEIEEKEHITETDIKSVNEILKKVKKVSLAEKTKVISKEELPNWLIENSYRIIKTAGSSSLAKQVKELENIPKQDIASFTSKENVLFYFITGFNRETRDPRLRVIFADENIWKNPCDFWQDIKTSGAIANERGVQLSGGKKPEKLINRIVDMTTNEGDIVLDYHSGSGTTAGVAHKMKRQWITIEQIDDQINLSLTGLNNVINGDKTGISELVNWKGGGDFIYMELAEWNNKWIREIREAKTSKELTKLWAGIKNNAFLSYKVLPEIIDANAKDFADLSIADQKKFLIECLDKNQLYVNLSEIEDKEYGVSKEDIKLNKEFYE